MRLVAIAGYVFYRMVAMSIAMASNDGVKATNAAEHEVPAF
jgi:hypothetical protein